MDAFEPQVVRDRGDMPGMVGNRQMTGRHIARNQLAGRGPPGTRQVTASH